MIKSFGEFLTERRYVYRPTGKAASSYSAPQQLSREELRDLERFGDALLNKFGIDIEFTKHFAERIKDPRNRPEIEVDEIKSLFKKIAKNQGDKIKKVKDSQAVLKDIQTSLNLPFVLDIDRSGELEVTFKTIMRKPNFKSPNEFVRY